MGLNKLTFRQYDSIYPIYSAHYTSGFIYEYVKESGTKNFLIEYPRKSVGKGRGYFLKKRGRLFLADSTTLQRSGVLYIA